MTQPPEHILSHLPTLTEVVDEETLRLEALSEAAVASALPPGPEAETQPATEPEPTTLNPWASEVPAVDPLRIAQEAQHMALESFKERFQNEVSGLESKLRLELQDMVQKSVEDALKYSDQTSDLPPEPNPQP
jgi:hypothetical protein